MSMRIATYNIYFGGMGREPLIADVLQVIAADAVVLTEAGNRAVVERIAHILGMEHVIAAGQRTSIAVLSRFPVISSEVFMPGWLKRPLLAATLRVSDQFQATLYGLHLQPHYMRRDENRRVREIRAYLHHVGQRRPGAHLLLGDFNAIAPGDTIKRSVLPLKEKVVLWWQRGQLHGDAITLMLRGGYTDCFRTLHPGAEGVTVPVDKPKVRLDYIFADPLMRERLKACDVVTHPAETRKASDHFPLFADFEI